MIGDEESGGRECARIARPLSHQLLNLHPFSGRGGAKRRSAVGAGQELCFVVCDLAVSSELKVSLITRKSGPQPNVMYM